MKLFIIFLVVFLSISTKAETLKSDAVKSEIRELNALFAKDDFARANKFEISTYGDRLTQVYSDNTNTIFTAYIGLAKLEKIGSMIVMSCSDTPCIKSNKISDGSGYAVQNEIAFQFKNKNARDRAYQLIETIVRATK
jgi:hypothetical protein